jgi:uncharacterized protein YqgV (UPF0045/DUF77 family)
MNITAEISLYPLTENFSSAIKDYINDLNEVKGLEVRTQSLSTEVFGEFDLVMDTIKETTKKYFEADPSTILVAKILNRDRRKEIS